MASHVPPRFKWVVCQLETLRNCLAQSIRQTLEELPSTLDETYERGLQGIDNEKREYAECLFQCLAVSVRPLRAEELAEAMVVSLNAKVGSPVNACWRPQDPEEEVLRTCSSLITIIEIDGSRVVQFSHFSVKEFLFSSRLAAHDSLSHYHILPRPAHITLARICLRILLQLDKCLDKRSIKNVPLAEYAAQHWVEHARFEDVSTYVSQEMDSLFDPSKPHFSVWAWIRDLDPCRKRSAVSSYPTTPGASPLHYAAECGLLGLVERLATLRPKEVQALDENSRTPLHAALHGGHTEVAQVLLSCGANKDARDEEDRTPLHIALQNGNQDIVRLLLQEGADPNTQARGHQTPLDIALYNGDFPVIRSLLEHGANVNTRDDNDLTPLHIAFQRGDLNACKLLLDHGANVNACGKDRQTPLHLASWGGEIEFTRLFLGHEANVNARGDRNRTPLLLALGGKKVAIVRLLLEHGADVSAKGADWDETPLHLASENGELKIMSLLLKHGADVDARDSRNRTPLHMALGSANPPKIPRELLKHGAKADVTDSQGRTPLHMASKSGRVEVVRLLLKHSANVNARSGECCTPLHVASETGHLEIVRLLLEKGADPKARTNDSERTTSLHMASKRGWLEVAKLLVKNGADVNSKDKDGWTPLHVALEYNWTELKVALWLVDLMEDVNKVDSDGNTPLHFATMKGHLEVVRSLCRRGANVHAPDKNGKTPFQLAPEVIRRYFESEISGAGGNLADSIPPEAKAK